jgi:hypothetical protein
LQYRATFAHTFTSRIAYHGMVWALLAKLAHAQEVAAPVEPPSPSPEAAAAAPVLQTTALPALPDDFQYGLDALKAGNYHDAALWFKAIYDRDQTPGALLNLGIAYANLGQPHPAVQALESYISHADPQRDAQSIADVRAELERLRGTNGRIGVHLIPADATVELDGETVTLQGGELFAAPGKHKITARARGYKLLELTLDVIAGQFTLEIELEKITPVAPVAVAAAVPADTKLAPAQTEPTDEPEASAASSCALASVCMGPVVSLLGPPNLIGGGLHVRIGHYLGVGVDYQALPTLNFSPVSIGTSLVSGNARVYPFGGAFFLGGGIGYQTIRAGLHEGDISVSARTGFPAAMASIGFMGHDGFVLGMDLGLMFPLGSPRVSIQANTGKISQAGISQADVDEAKGKAETQVNKVLGQMPLLVQVNLLRLGYMF